MNEMKWIVVDERSNRRVLFTLYITILTVSLDISRQGCHEQLLSVHLWAITAPTQPMMNDEWQVYHTTWETPPYSFYPVVSRVCKFYWWVESVWLLLHKLWSHFEIIIWSQVSQRKKPFSLFPARGPSMYVLQLIFLFQVIFVFPLFQNH